jgi:hypothetical protein
MTELAPWSRCPLGLCLCWRGIKGSVCIPGHNVLSIRVERADLLLLVLLLWLSGFHVRLAVQEVVHLRVLLVHHVLGSVVLVVPHLVLHYWLVLELLKTKVLLVRSSHVRALHELLTLCPSGVLLDWYLASLGLRRELLLSLSKLLLFALALAQFPSLRVILKPNTYKTLKG